MMKSFLTMLIFMLLGTMCYLIYKDEKNKPSPEQRKIQEAEWIAQDVSTMCVKGVLYYYTSGPHSARMAPAIDNITLQFIRCN